MGFRRDTTDAINELREQLHELTKHVRNSTEDCERIDTQQDTLHQRLDTLITRDLGPVDHSPFPVAFRIDWLEASAKALPKAVAELNDRLDALEARDMVTPQPGDVWVQTGKDGEPIFRTVTGASDGRVAALTDRQWTYFQAPQSSPPHTPSCGVTAKPVAGA